MNKQMLPVILALIAGLVFVCWFTNALERLFIANICLLFLLHPVYAKLASFVKRSKTKKATA